MIDLDFTVRLGDLAQVISVATGGIVVLAHMRAQARLDSARLDRVETELAKQTEILSRLAAGDARMDGIDHRLRLLEKA